MQWNTAPRELLNTYRVAHTLPTPAAFSSPLNQALLTNPGIGRQSPVMARKKEKRRVSQDQLALAVRKHFNGAAVNETDVIAELVYKVKNQGEFTYGCYVISTSCFRVERKPADPVLQTRRSVCIPLRQSRRSSSGYRYQAFWVMGF